MKKIILNKCYGGFGVSDKVYEEYAKEIGVKVIIALGIPGKEQPKTAARYMKDAISKCI